MNIAFALFKFFPYGGLQRNMRAMAEEAIKRGHTVTVFCSHWEGDIPSGVKVWLLPVKKLTNAGRTSAFIGLLLDTLAAQSFDIVVGFNKMPGLDLYYAADSCFAYKANYERGFFYRLSGRTQAYLCNEAAVFGADAKTLILEVSPRERGKFQRCYNTPNKRFITLPPGIARDRALPANFDALRADLRREIGAKGSDVLMLVLGSGFRTKGLDRAIAVLAELRQSKLDVALVVAGQDKSRPFERQAARLQVRDRVYFLGGRSDVSALLQAADVLIHPAYKENTGNVLLEAMIAGKPVVTSDVCGYAHYVIDAAMGYVVEKPYAITAFSQAVKKCIDTPAEHWRELGRRFSMNDEIYSRPQFAVDVMETLGYRS
ncbi:MAG: glycosyltransferase family 4 protein [Exilibacterium sp.]